ncbi:MAG: methionyl-tRNA formyltransferase [Myxococcales bacterium]|nr:methionyl-tRNA formyltransferase [Myxococcales bacterium]
MIRSLFFATDPIALPALTALCQQTEIEVLALVTQPLRPSGRGRKQRESALVLGAQSLGLPIQRPHRLDSEEGDRILHQYQPDFCLVMAYGQIICRRHLDAIPGPWLNLHGSLLPRWRGAAPIERAIEAGDEETGMMFMAMEEGLDTGAIYSERRVKIGEHRTSSLRPVMGELAADLIREDLMGILQGEIPSKAQESEGSTYAKRLRAEEGWIDFMGAADVWSRRARAFDPRPGLTCVDPQGRRLKLWHCFAQEGGGDPGRIESLTSAGLVVQCEVGCLVVTELQIEGRKRMKVSDFVHASSLQIGEHLAFVGTC